MADEKQKNQQQGQKKEEAPTNQIAKQTGEKTNEVTEEQLVHNQTYVEQVNEKTSKH